MQANRKRAAVVFSISGGQIGVFEVKAAVMKVTGVNTIILVVGQNWEDG